MSAAHLGAINNGTASILPVNTIQQDAALGNRSLLSAAQVEFYRTQYSGRQCGSGGAGLRAFLHLEISKQIATGRTNSAPSTVFLDAPARKTPDKTQEFHGTEAMGPVQRNPKTQLRLTETTQIAH
jgi:hypothetical protein